MNTSIATLGGASMLFVGVYALSESASQSESTALQTDAGGSAYNTSVAVFDGLGQAASPGLVYMGVAALILVSLGILVSTAGGGR